MGRRDLPKETSFHFDPLYGSIPLIPRKFLDDRGRTHVAFDYDLDYAPPLPLGAVRGDVRKQNLCFGCHVPKYFYVDEKRECIQCGQPFIFGAREQKFWYESLGFYATSEAIRCRSCRQKQRSEKALRAQIASAKAGARTNPEDPGAWLSLAEAIIRYHQRTGHGDLEEAIAAARRVRKLAPLAEARFWEALGHIQAGRRGKALPLLQEFLKHPARTRRERRLSNEAEGLLK
jgi:hypothetical protein